jgi:hypothetical protein
MNEARLLANRIVTPDGTMLQSYHRHDCVTYIDANEKEYMVDGGLDYHRAFVYRDAPYTNACVYTTDPHVEIREAFCWGSYGKDGKQPLHWKLLKTMTDEHIEAILETQHHIREYIRKVFEDEQVYRKSLNIEIKE